MDYNKDYLDIVKPLVKETRFTHILGVIDEAVLFAEIYNVDKNKARIAASLHDITKYMPLDKQKDLIIKNYPSVNMTDLPPQVYHSLSGAVVAESLGVDDIEIINAIYYHSMGRPNMTMLEKIIYVADFSEKNRDYPEAKIAHEIAIKNIDEAVYYVLDNVNKYLIERKYRISKTSAQTIKYYKELLNK